jgi:hypothetical protein
VIIVQVMDIFNCFSADLKPAAAAAVQEKAKSKINLNMTIDSFFCIQYT